MPVPAGRQEFIALKTGESTQFEVRLDGSFLLADPALRHLKLRYSHTGLELGTNTWVGSVEAEFGAAWKAQRRIETVEEKWPNGNFKAKGQTVNGQHYGEWHYFNENGDRIKTVDYTGGHGTAICNPEHPDNKGAGKRPKQNSPVL